MVKIWMRLNADRVQELETDPIQGLDGLIRRKEKTLTPQNAVANTKRTEKIERSARDENKDEMMDEYEEDGDGDDKPVGVIRSTLAGYGYGRRRLEMRLQAQLDESWHSQGTAYGGHGPGYHMRMGDRARLWELERILRQYKEGFKGLEQDKDSTRITGQKSRGYRIKGAENSVGSIGVKKSPIKARKEDQEE
ncbi:hypothetical protein PPACK8108_LOCUS13548 [Phakopsora pachyrhizi]|uniref:Uncharacterized protein n=1 Tax=Phakopsora pachyrhizi TaxID=170000 RepID=A0AAV0B6V1_PHAPC|nr:hypothetical protein PPACK8108_LOCUS13548 [Phakopsora pachyrhizi]